MHLNAQSVYLKYLTFSNFLNLFPHKHWECYISVNTLPLQTAVPGLAVPGAAGARHQHGDACQHARTAPRKLFNQVEYLIVSTSPGLSCQVHLLGTFCKFINQTFGVEVSISTQFCSADLTALPPAVRRWPYQTTVTSTATRETESLNQSKTTQLYTRALSRFNVCTIC